MQLTVQNQLIDPLLDSDKPVEAPRMMQLFNTFPFLRRIPARVVGIGVRPEHIRTKPHGLTESERDIASQQA
jgi:hypothetical protein